MAKGKKTGGRRKGTPNKTTKEIKEAFHLLIENNIDKLDLWLQQTAKKNPEKALEFILRVSEMFIPKMQRMEMKEVKSEEEVIEVRPTIKLPDGQIIEI